ncbi:hypothetical protein [Vibrio sp. WXL103]|uniref:hypothetical protein n=1 Tax=unclassified Vibrio TaxID=2614977 RepID=UPI003EC537EC
MKAHRGALSAEMALYVTVTLILLVSFIPLLSHLARDYLDARHIKAYVHEIVAQSHAFYGESVLTSRCLAHNDLSMANLGMNTDEHNATFSVAYFQSSVTNTKPSGIEVTVTFPSTPHGVNRWLRPHDNRNDTMIFVYPLDFHLPDWQHLDRNTGCIG